MKTRRLSGLTLVALTTVIARAAAFQNLDFEAANIVSPPSGPYGHALVSEALPGWSLDWTPIGGGEGYGPDAQFVGYNRMFLMSTHSALLVGPQRDDYPGVGPIPPPISGNYSAGGLYMKLSQRGEIPAGRTGLVFETNDMPQEDRLPLDQWLKVTLNDTVLPVVPTGLPGQFRADISAWAGQEVVLAFSTGENLSVIDNISLVPEPTTWGLAFGLPLAALAAARGRRRASSPS
ncbi:MAG: hypothetical protein JNL10_03115 [Verrucomicrobiales bacterium]|nr:hypothetical protein [Verrucomicrobiales bacterium]